MEAVSNSQTRFYILIKKVNIYIVYEINVRTNNDNYPTLENCLFGAVTLTKNADIDKI